MRSRSTEALRQEYLPMDSIGTSPPFGRARALDVGPETTEGDAARYRLSAGRPRGTWFNCRQI